MATDKFKDKSSFAVHAAPFVCLVGWLGFLVYMCTNIRGLGLSERECFGEGGFSSTIFIAIDFVLIS